MDVQLMEVVSSNKGVEDMADTKGNGVDRLSIVEEKLDLLLECIGELKEGQDELTERVAELTLNYGAGMSVESYDN